MAAVQPENKINTGTLLAGKYRVTRELGRGGMAAVYEAEHVDIGKRIAIKVLAAELSSSAIVIERFVREARAAASVKSPYIVEVYDSGRLEDGRPFIAMELLEGESLYDRMARVRLIDTQSTVRVIGQVAKGLTKAHAIGIVHRDLKPENIHLVKHEDGEEMAKILDFGLAKFYSPVDTDEKTARLTREGAVFGTPAYMSPEQVKGQGSVDHRADLWALGCMAFECLTGRPVWNTDQGVAMTFAAIATAQLPVPSRLRPDLPPAFDLWFRKALERDPNRRFQTAKELADDLARSLDARISLVNVGGTPSQIELEAIAGLREVDRSSQPPSPRRPPSPGSGGAMGPGTPGAFGVVGAPIPGPPGVPGVMPGMPPSAPGMLPASHPGAHGQPGVMPGIPQMAPGVAGGAPFGRGSEPIDLMALGGPIPSAVEVPPAPFTDDLAPLRPRKGSFATRLLVSLLVLGAAGGGAWVLLPKVRAKVLGLRHPSQPPAAAVSASASESARTVPPPPEQPKWSSDVEEGQQLISSGDFDGALRKFKEASDEGGGAIAKSFLDQAKIASATSGPCKVVALGRPRLVGSGNAGRPAVAMSSKGVVIAWTDDHEQPGHDHVYSVLLDTAGRPTTVARDLTPEADYAMRPSLLAAGDRIALLYWDRAGRQPGVKARWLDADGRISGPNVEVGASKPGNYWPSIDRASDGNGFWVAWQANPDKEGDDIFLRRLDGELQPQGSEIRATDYEPVKGKAAKAGVAAVAASSANVFVAYTLERDRQSVVERLRIPASSPELGGVGLTEKAAAKGVHEIGEALIVDDEKVGGDYAALGCTTDACFLAWHEPEKADAEAALLDPAKGTLLWRKRFAPHGGHPAIATSVDGDAEVVFYEAGRVRVAPISRDGLGAASTFGRMTGDQPRAWIAPGRAKGEWVASWLDVEAGRTEPFLARLACRN